MPITWKNIQAPSFADVVASDRTAAASFDRGGEALTDLFRGMADRSKEANTNQALAQILGLDNREDYQTQKNAILSSLPAGVDMSTIFDATTSRYDTLQDRATQDLAMDSTRQAMKLARSAEGRAAELHPLTMAVKKSEIGPFGSEDLSQLYKTFEGVDGNGNTTFDRNRFSRAYLDLGGNSKQLGKELKNVDDIYGKVASGDWSDAQKAASKAEAAKKIADAKADKNTKAKNLAYRKSLDANIESFVGGATNRMTDFGADTPSEVLGAANEAKKNYSRDNIYNALLKSQDPDFFGNEYHLNVSDFWKAIQLMPRKTEEEGAASKLSADTAAQIMQAQGK